MHTYLFIDDTSFPPSVLLYFLGTFLSSKRSLFVSFNTGLPLREQPSIQKMKRLANILAVSHSATTLILLSPCVMLPLASHFSILLYLYSTFSAIPSVLFPSSLTFLSLLCFFYVCFSSLSVV